MPSLHPTRDLDYDLPKELIAQRPAAKRSESRLLILRRDSGQIEHRQFTDFVRELRPDDVLVINDTKVIPARLIGRRRTGGKVEALLIESQDADQRRWTALVKARGKLGEDEVIDLDGDARLRAVKRGKGMEWQVEILSERPTGELLAAVGLPPLPPYIGQDPADPAQRQEDLQRYQTVYARNDGAIAAPTAGLHFTEELVQVIVARGVAVVPVTLHVGLGTFLPIKGEFLEDHSMHSERFEVSEESAAAISRARADRRRIVAVGTTSCRVLESVDWSRARGAVKATTDLFIYPPFEFKCVRALLTNFHLPKSTLLALVDAFAGRELVRKAYREAVERKYRFYSYGDAMLIV